MKQYKPIEIGSNAFNFEKQKLVERKRKIEMSNFISQLILINYTFGKIWIWNRNRIIILWVGGYVITVIKDQIIYHNWQ